VGTMESGSTSPRGRKRDRLGNEKAVLSPTPVSGANTPTGSARRRPAAITDDQDKEPRYVGDPDYLEVGEDMLLTKHGHSQSQKKDTC
jgi:hypothetical protein